jgi:hypothetical protein
VTQLSRLAHLGIAKETVAGTYVVPTAFIPFTKADWEDVIASLRDESVRANDTVLQGMYQGPTHATWSLDVSAYPDLIGHFLRGIIGPDTVTAGVSTTLSANSLVAATSLSTAASIAANTVIRIGTGPSLEYAKVTAVSGSGPYTLTVAALALPHTSGDAVVAQSTHSFAQSTNPATKATYSMTVYDTVGTTGYAGAAMSDLQIKIDPKGIVTISPKWTCMPGVPQSLAVPSFVDVDPMLGWQWGMNNAGASSTRGLSYDLTVKRAVDPIASSDGNQGPREIFQGALEADASYKAIFESTVDLDLYLANTQSPAIATLTQPVSRGGALLTLTMSKSGWSKGKRDLGSDYVQADFSVSGIWNSTDGGAVAATLKNFQSTAY